MRTTNKLSYGAAVFGLLALPVVSLFGGLTANAATALPEVKDGKITLEAGKDYDGFKMPANTELVGNGATINGTVTLAGGNVNIHDVTFKGNGKIRAIYATVDAPNVTIKDVTFNGYSAQNNHTVELAGAKNYSNLHIENMTDDNAGGNNVTVVPSADTKGVTIISSTFHNTVRVEGNAKGYLSGLTVKGNTFEDVITTAISVDKTTGAVIEENGITSTGSKLNPLIALSAAQGAMVKNNNVTGNGSNSAVQLNQVAGATDGVTISGTVVKNVATGIELYSVKGTTTLEGNSVWASKSAVAVKAYPENALKTAGNVIITKSNSLNGDKSAVSIDKGVMIDDAKVEISKEAKLTGAVTANGATVEYKDEPAVDNTDTEVTKPREESKATAPNTGAQNVVSAIMVATSIAAIAAVGALVASKYAKANK